jgi:hypothetical protein
MQLMIDRIRTRRARRDAGAWALACVLAGLALGGVLWARSSAAQIDLPSMSSAGVRR